MEVKQTKERATGQTAPSSAVSSLRYLAAYPSAQRLSHTLANVPPVVKQQEPGNLSVHPKSFSRNVAENLASWAETTKAPGNVSTARREKQDHGCSGKASAAEASQGSIVILWPSRVSRLTE